MGNIRIIGGKWRGRKIVVSELEDLRPTPSRVRETLFNWLAPLIHGARCLDCFAGTGVLGFEALSRGAEFVTLLEQSKQQVRHLRTMADTLVVTPTHIQIQCTDTLQWLSCSKTLSPFDVVFLDPPFSQKLWQLCLTQILLGGFCHQETYIYIECPANYNVLSPLSEWRLVKSKQAGNVKYQLLQHKNIT